MLTRSRAKAASCFPLLALHSDLLQLVILELPSGADVKALSRSCDALYALVINGGLELAAAWLWRQHGNHALMKAQQQQDVAMLRQLVEVHHADVNVNCGAYGDTILHKACRGGQLEVVGFLVTVPGLQVNKKPEGTTALHWAFIRGHELVVLELLKHPSINVNKADRTGLTALHLAVFCNEVQAARALLSHPGINMHIEDVKGETARAIAQRRAPWKGPEMAALLTAHAEATSHRSPAGSA